MRPDTQQNQPPRDKRNESARGKIGKLSEEEVQICNFSKNPKEAKYRQGANSRLCGNLTQLDMHIKSSETGNKHGNA